MTDTIPIRPDYTRQTWLTAQQAAEYLEFPTVDAFRKYRRRHQLLPCASRRLLFLRSAVDRAFATRDPLSWRASA